jgi:RecJ-like exonuclease
MEKTITICGVEHPAKWGICDRCEGDGTTGNPAYNGLSCSGEFMQENPEFLEEYMDGKYDILCPSCKGSGKVLIPSTDEGFNAWEIEQFDLEMAEMDREAELRMGC